MRRPVGPARPLHELHREISPSAALLESTLLHARALIEFLLNSKEKRDIQPRDLCPGWHLPDDHQGTTRNRLVDLKDATDKHLAHLSWERVPDDPSQDAPSWPYPLIVEEIVGHIREFHEQFAECNPLAASPLGTCLARIERKVAARRVDTKTFYESRLGTTTSAPTQLTVSRINPYPLALTDLPERPPRRQLIPLASTAMIGPWGSAPGPPTMSELALRSSTTR